ncbi:hypothetical protein KBTX_02696 [wastewater metagenome]|uniref:Uncharacterized protein n=2 Tax=unclassified sequences TaxID=12908 RepID=A0A5B8RFT0_9ZZZZ|nr:hypothetical protein KBTEX_02696 [uncultured organism]
MFFKRLFDGVAYSLERLQEAPVDTSLFRRCHQIRLHVREHIRDSRLGSPKRQNQHALFAVLRFAQARQQRLGAIVGKCLEQLEVRRTQGLHRMCRHP